MNGAKTQRHNTSEYQLPDTYAETRLPVEHATTLIPDAYASPEFYQLEQEQIFAKGWVAAGCAEEVENPGDILVVEVAGRSILIIRDKQGNLGAFYNVCRHRGSKLLEKSCNNKSIRCPYHGWVFGLDGSCLGTPMFQNKKTVAPDAQMLNAKDFDKKDYGLLKVNVEIWGFLIFVNLSVNPTPLNEWLGDLPQLFETHRLNEWKISGRKNYDVAANYKLIAENFMEYYHLPFVHPELSDVSRVEDHYRCQGAGMYTGMYTSPVSRDVHSVWLILPSADQLDEKHKMAAYHIGIFPNVCITVLPNHAFCLLCDPLANDQTRERTYLLTPPGTLDSEINHAMFAELANFWDLVNQQDLGIVESVQEGLSNLAYGGGRMCYQFEEPLHRYQNWVADRMCGIHRVPPADAE